MLRGQDEPGVDVRASARSLGIHRPHGAAPDLPVGLIAADDLALVRRGLDGSGADNGSGGEGELHVLNEGWVCAESTTRS